MRDRARRAVDLNQTLINCTAITGEKKPAEGPVFFGNLHRQSVVKQSVTDQRQPEKCERHNNMREFFNQ